MEELEKNWEEILQRVKEELELDDIKFKTWVKPLKIYAVQDDCVYIVWNGEQLGITYITKKYMSPLKMAIIEITGIEYEVEFISTEQAEKIEGE